MVSVIMLFNFWGFFGGWWCTSAGEKPTEMRGRVHVQWKKIECTAEHVSDDRKPETCQEEW